MNNGVESYIEEYKVLRQEILQTQNIQTYVLGFTIAFVGALMQTSLTQGDLLATMSSWFILDSLALIGIVSALHISISHTHDIDRMASYIRIYIEPHIEGIKWETRLATLREPENAGQRLITNMLKGRSKYLALVYFLLATVIIGSIFIRNIGMSYQYLAVPCVLFVWISFLSISLYAKRFFPGFKANWENKVK